MTTNKLKCAVLDDDPMAIEIIKDNLKESSIAEITGCYSCPKKFLNNVFQQDFEILLLDITMPEINGFEVAKRLLGKPVIFITGVEKNLKTAAQSIAIDVIWKPYTKSRLDAGLEKAYKIIRGSIGNATEYELFDVADENGQVRIRLSDIVFAITDEHDRRHKNIILRDGKKYKLLYCTFEKITHLSDRHFQVNKSELISLDAIHAVEMDLITLDFPEKNGKPKQVTLSRYFKQEFNSRIHSKK